MFPSVNAIFILAYKSFKEVNVVSPRLLLVNKNEIITPKANPETSQHEFGARYTNAISNK